MHPRLHTAHSQYSDEVHLLRPTGSNSLRSTTTISSQSTSLRTIAASQSWRSSVTISFLALIFHSILGILCCSVSAFSALTEPADGSRWTSLHSFGPPLPLLTARYLSFALDVCARIFSITLGLLLAIVALRSSTALYTTSRGIRVSDALVLNDLRLEVASIWDTLRSGVPRRLKIAYVNSILLGLVVYLAGSLVFGYSFVAVEQPGIGGILMGSNRMLLGSNTSGSFISPDYTSLIPSDGSISRFTSAAAHAIMKFDLSPSNSSDAAFDLSAETPTSLSARNISKLLVSETVSSQLVDCQPVPLPSPDPRSIAFGAQTKGRFVTQMWQDLSSTITPGATNRFAEHIFTDANLFSFSRLGLYTFIMTLADSTIQPPAPADESQVLIVLAQLGSCRPDPFQTPFGPMPHAWINTTILAFNYTVNLLHNHAALACRNMRTITRTIRTPDGAQVESKSESFYAKLILSAANQLYMYTPMLVNQGLGGVGTIALKDLSMTSKWEFPSCEGAPGFFDRRFDPGSRFFERQNITVPVSNSTVLDAISAAWGLAVLRIQHYETHFLQALVKQDIAPVPANVIHLVQMYKLAVIPAALLVYGGAMVGLTFILISLLVGMGSKTEGTLGAKSLTVLRVANDASARRQELDGEDAHVEIPERALRASLGSVRIKRRPMTK
ncbi:hypothetical protein BDV93DRAFT_524892 [Ceratobasidium sp. AG-I]|nr:hypothetical protein BDV93DRAFT_524892 [Ceratobasidium sp. AG-I]